MIRRLTPLFAALLCAAASTSAIAAGSNVKVESSEAVRSPDGKRIAVVDRLSPIVDGELERNSGKMMIRVSAPAQGQNSQRFIEASQVRVIHAPVWDPTGNVAAFSYNVAKNSNGVVYFDPATNRALQVEFVAATRRMGATGKVVQELTSLEVTDHTSPSIHIRTVPFEGKSVFPLAMELPTYEGRPFGPAFYQSLLKSADAYRDFLSKNSFQGFAPEEASESFNDAKTHIAALACGGGKSYLLVAPLKGDSATVLAQSKLLPLEGVLLSCAQHSDSQEEDPASDSHFATTWADDNTVLVQMETFGAEDDSSRKTDIFSYDVKAGKLQKLADPATVAVQNAPKAPAPGTEPATAP